VIWGKSEKIHAEERFTWNTRTIPSWSSERSRFRTKDPTVCPEQNR
jgi:hypothetical protein